MEEKKMLVKRLVSGVLALFFLAFGISWKNRFCLGDVILNAVGLPAWSKGTQGLHYPGIVALIGVTISFYMFATTTKDAKKTMYKLFMGTVAVMCILSIMI